MTDAGWAGWDAETEAWEAVKGRLPTITLSGVDRRTDPSTILALMAAPNVELGLLWSETNDDPRYLRVHEVAYMLGLAHAEARGCAVHVCGRTARDVFLGLRYSAQVARGSLEAIAKAATEQEDVVAARTIMVHHASRVQMNGRWSEEGPTIKLAEVARATGILSMSTRFARFSAPRIITQWRPGEPTCCIQRIPNQAVLVDASGGQGITPERWETPGQWETSCPVGFAGGLSPENLKAELPKIMEVARPGFWVDMESSLRVDGRFDLARARQAVRVFNTFMLERG